MGTAAAARKLASAAAFGGGGLSVLGAGLYGVLVAEARLARRAIGTLTDDPPPDATGWYGRGRPGPAIRIALLGDSSAAGYGVERVEDTPGAHLASGVAAQADRRVHLREHAVVGAQSSDLDSQVDAALATHPDVAVILIGANDVTHTVTPSQSVRHLSEAVRRLREAEVAVLVGTCPDLGTIKPIAPPLKQVARSWSRRLAAAQTIAVVEAGGRTVSLGLGARPGVRSPPRRCSSGPTSSTPAPTATASWRPSSCRPAWPPSASGPTTRRCPRPSAARASCRSPTAAAQAVNNPGTELDGTEVSGSQRGLRGRWVELRRRRRRPGGETETPETSEGDAVAGARTSRGRRTA